jgi:peptidoglycan/xylan/chitin deacetylase (PgdA/CDA1 family)
MKDKLIRLFVKCGGSLFFLHINRCPRVFCFHGVDRVINPEVEEESLPEDLFLQQINFLRDNFEIISIQEFEYRYHTKTFTNHEAVITFDDGYESIFRVVDPILRSYDIPYTVFVSAHNISTGQLFTTSVNRLVIRTDSINRVVVPSLAIDEPLISHEKRIEVSNRISRLFKAADIDTTETIDKELQDNLPYGELDKLKRKYKSVIPMSWDQVRELESRGGVTIGSHCCRHISCHNNQDITIVEKELVESKEIIEREIGKECRYFAYPNGCFTTESNDIVRRIYSMGFSIVAEERIDYQNDLAAIPRLYVFGRDIETFKTFITRYPFKRR